MVVHKLDISNIFIVKSKNKFKMANFLHISEINFMRKCMNLSGTFYIN